MNHDHTQSHHVGARLTAVCVAVIVLAVLFALSGCADTGQFQTRPLCSVDKKTAFIDSRWFGFGITTKLSNPVDIEKICADAVKL